MNKYKLGDVLILKIQYDKSVDNIISKAKDLAKSLGMPCILSSHLAVILLQEHKAIFDELFSPHYYNYEMLVNSLNKYMYQRKRSLDEMYISGNMYEVLNAYDITSNNQIPTLIASLIIYGDIPYAYYQCDLPKSTLIKHIKNKLNLTEKNPPITTAKSINCEFDYCTNLTQLAHDNTLDPVFERQNEISQIINILLCKKKCNVLLLGEAGVGKTAIIEKLAQLIIKNEVPAGLLDITILSLNVAAMLAGTSNRGDFEARIQTLLNQLQKHSTKVILFIDEIHTILGAGSEGYLDLANILKPALARGGFYCIGATTLKEYKKYMEKDAAFVRRFQNVHILEPTPKQTIDILYKLKSVYEDFHKIKFTKSALQACVTLTNKYLITRRLPDKAIDLMDEVGAIAKQQNISIVEDNLVAEVLSKKIGIPISLTNQQLLNEILFLESELKQKVIGQVAAINALKQALINTLCLRDERTKPQCILWFYGPQGVGKSQFINSIASLIFHNKESVLQLNMSEYQERHTISKLLGSPPGYTGSEEGGMLTEWVRNHPHSLLVFHDIELAHKDVINVIYQIINNGYLTDSSGNQISFTHTIIILDSNYKQKRLFLQHYQGKDDFIIKHNQKFGKNFFLNIDSFIQFNFLQKNDIQQICQLQLAHLKRNLIQQKVEVDIDSKVIEFVIKKSVKKDLTANELVSNIQKIIVVPLNLEILSSKKRKYKILLATDNQRILIKNIE